MTANAPTILTFAYGSNMLTARIRARCPSATAHGVAELRGYAIQWHKRSSDGSGKCNIVASDIPTSVVYGVLFAIDLSEKDDLDRAEGLAHGYAEKDVEVLAGETRCTARIYYATLIDDSLMPYTWYRQLVVAGAREHGLPPAYIEGLNATDGVEDPDERRARRHVTILTTGRLP